MKDGAHLLGAMGYLLVTEALVQPLRFSLANATHGYEVDTAAKRAVCAAPRHQPASQNLTNTRELNKIGGCGAVDR